LIDDELVANYCFAWSDELEKMVGSPSWITARRAAADISACFQSHTIEQMWLILFVALEKRIAYKPHALTSHREPTWAGDIHSPRPFGFATSQSTG